MKICLERTGGIACFAKPLGGTVEVDDLPEALANEAKKLLQPKLLSKAAAPPPAGAGQRVDRQEIKVGIWQGGRYHEFHLNEENPDTDLFDLCNEIVNELVRCQIARRSDGGSARD